MTNSSLWKQFFLFQVQLVFKWKDLHLASFRQWGFVELENGYLKSAIVTSVTMGVISKSVGRR